MNRVDNFDVRQCFPEHIMHILFDGVVRYETKRFLKVLIDEKRSLTLKELTYRMESFNYGSSKGGHPGTDQSESRI